MNISFCQPNLSTVLEIEDQVNTLAVRGNIHLRSGKTEKIAYTMEDNVLNNHAVNESGLINQSSNAYRLPVIYFFVLSERHCDAGLPEYIKHSLIQAVMTQQDADVMLISNYKQCPKMKMHVDLLQGVLQIESESYSNEREKKFHNLSGDMFQDDGSGNLWVTSALRFFFLEEIMKQKGYKEVIHIEADNMLYGSFTSLLDIFRSGYKNSLAATPLNSNKTFMTASVLWIANVATISFFNDFLMSLAENAKFLHTLPPFHAKKQNELTSDGKPKGLWDLYLDWLAPYACCKYGGVRQDAKGMGLKPFAINEMSLMAYFHELFPERFMLLPVVPNYDFVLNKHIANITEYTPAGRESGQPTSIGKFSGIWDPNSWGQYLGGTSPKNGRDKGFTDGSHIAGIAIRIAHCRPHMMCGNKIMHRLPIERRVIQNGTSPALECYTVPHARCGDISSNNNSQQNYNNDWSPLWNLHVHSKHTANYVSSPCECGT